MPGFWHLMRSFYDGDTYPALPANIKLIDQLVSKTQAANSMVLNGACKQLMWTLGPLSKLFAKAKVTQF